MRQIIPGNGRRSVKIDPDPEIKHMKDILSEIVADVKGLRKDIQSKDVNIFKVLAQASVPREDPNIAIMKTVLPELLRNPEALQIIAKMPSKKES